jgi:hypothetical protein
MSDGRHLLWPLPSHSHRTRWHRRHTFSTDTTNRLPKEGHAPVPCSRHAQSTTCRTRSRSYCPVWVGSVACARPGPCPNRMLWGPERPQGRRCPRTVWNRGKGKRLYAYDIKTCGAVPVQRTHATHRYSARRTHFSTSVGGGLPAFARLSKVKTVRRVGSTTPSSQWLHCRLSIP